MRAVRDELSDLRCLTQISLEHGVRPCVNRHSVFAFSFSCEVPWLKLHAVLLLLRIASPESLLATDQPHSPTIHQRCAVRVSPRDLFNQQNTRARTTVVCFTAVLEQAVHDYLASATDVDFPVDYDRNSKSHSRWSRVARTGLLAVVEHLSQVGGEGEQHVLASGVLQRPHDTVAGSIGRYGRSWPWPRKRHAGLRRRRTWKSSVAEGESFQVIVEAARVVRPIPVGGRRTHIRGNGVGHHLCRVAVVAGMVFPHVVAVNQINRAVLGGGNHQVRHGSQLVDHHGSSGSKVHVVYVLRKRIEGFEVVGQVQRAAGRAKLEESVGI
jgi:hypothetical protein